MSRLTTQPWRNLDPEFVGLVVNSAVRADDIADEVTASVRQRVAADIDDVTLANLRLTAAAGLAQFVAEAGHPSAPVDRDIFRAHGRAQYLAGRSIEEMLDLYQLVGLAFWRRISQAVQAVGVDLVVFSDVTEALFAYVADLASAAGDGYVAAGAQAARDQQVRRDRLVSLLFATPTPGPQALAAAARAAEWPVPSAVAVAVLEADTGEEVLGQMPSSILVGRHGMTAIAIIPAPQLREYTQRIERLLRGHSAGLGPIVDLSRVDESRRRGNELLALGLRRSDGANTALRLEGNEIDLMVLADHELARDLVASTLSPLDELAEDKQSILIDTLERWLAQPDQPLAIARDMHVHVQTVRYRIRQLRSLLGDSIDDPGGRTRLAVAVRAHRLLGSRDPH